MDKALTRLTINNNIIIENGKAVINVILCKAASPPALSNNNASAESKIPHPTVCHLGEFLAFLVAILFITNVPESAEVTKKMMIMAIVKKLSIFVNGKYSRNRNIRASGLLANWLNAPLATLTSNHIALLPKTDINIKVNKITIIKTATLNTLIVLPFEILAINNTTYTDHEIHPAQYSIDQS